MVTCSTGSDFSSLVGTLVVCSDSGAKKVIVLIVVAMVTAIVKTLLMSLRYTLGTNPNRTHGGRIGSFVLDMRRTKAKISMITKDMLFRQS